MASSLVRAIKNVSNPLIKLHEVLLIHPLLWVFGLSDSCFSQPQAFSIFPRSRINLKRPSWR